MRDVADSKAIRDKFGAYFIGMKDGKDGRPENLKRYSVRNFVTPETKVRIAVLQVLTTRYRNSNPGSKVQVVGYDPRCPYLYYNFFFYLPKLRIFISELLPDGAVRIFPITYAAA